MTNHKIPCYFSSKGERPFRYSDNCRNCLESKHYHVCSAYIPSHSQGDKTIGSKNHADGKEDDSSRANDGHKTLDTYSHQQKSQQSTSVGDVIKRNEQRISDNDKVLRPFYWYHSEITTSLNPKNTQKLIREINDNGCIS